MARMRIWDIKFQRWLDIVDYPTYVMHNDKWKLLEPNKFSVLNTHGERWEPIDDKPDPMFDDPCAAIENVGCNGSPSSQTRGSGDGKGSGGAKYDQLNGYPAGYDLPDAGKSGFGVLHNGAAPTGRAINRIGIHKHESYDPTGVGSRTGLGSYANPNLTYNSVAGRGAAITETVYALPRKQGRVEILFASYDPQGMSVDVYHMGERVASTCGIVTGRGRISFQFDNGAEDMRVMIRVRGQQGHAWNLVAFPPVLHTTSDRANLPLDYQLSYDVIRFPDAIDMQYLGTPLFPAPCHATVRPTPNFPNRIAATPAFEYYHYVGSKAGWMYLDYRSWEGADYFEVYQAGVRIATTLDPHNFGTLRFWYDPHGTPQHDIMVRVVDKTFLSGAALDNQYYSLYCQDTRGSREYRHPCESYQIMSAGHDLTDDCFELGTQTDRRAVSITVHAGSYDTRFEVYDNKWTLLDQEELKAGQSGTLEFWKETQHVDRSKITVRVISELGSDWSYWVWCPIQPAKLEHRDLLLTYNCLEVEDEATDWSLVQERIIYFSASVDHTVWINFKAVTETGESWKGSGRNQVWKDGAASVGGVLYKSNETKHGDISSTVEYNPVREKMGSLEVERVELSQTYSGGTGTSIRQQPTKANGWMGIIDITEYRSGEHWVTVTAKMKVYYKKV